MKLAIMDDIPQECFDILNKYLPFNPQSQPVSKEYRILYEAALRAMIEYNKNKEYE